MKKFSARSIFGQTDVYYAPLAESTQDHAVPAKFGSCRHCTPRVIDRDVIEQMVTRPGSNPLKAMLSQWCPGWGRSRIARKETETIFLFKLQLFIRVSAASWDRDCVMSEPFSFSTATSLTSTGTSDIEVDATSESLPNAADASPKICHWPGLAGIFSVACLTSNEHSQAS